MFVLKKLKEKGKVRVLAMHDSISNNTFEQNWRVISIFSDIFKNAFAPILAWYE